MGVRVKLYFYDFTDYIYFDFAVEDWYNLEIWKYSTVQYSTVQYSTCVE